MIERPYTNRRYLDALQQRVLIYDGAMGTNLQKMNLTAEHFGGEQYVGCNDYLVLSYPQAVEQVHRSFLDVGVDVIETDTFRSNRITLAEYGLDGHVVEINRSAAALARRLADEYTQKTGQERFVAGSIGPSGKLPSAADPELSNISFDELADVFREQATGLLQGGVDVILIETSQDILEVKATIAGVQRAFAETGMRVPLQVQVTLDTNGRMLLGTDIAAALAILEGLPIDVIGLNCSTGPDLMRDPIRYLGENARLPVSCIPNAGLPLNIDGVAVYPLEPEPFAETLIEFVTRHNISVVGGCCGTTPAHLKLLVERLRGHPHPPRPVKSLPYLASATQAVSLLQDPPPFLIGERCNAQGSRKFKELLLAEDYEAILEIARQQVEFGAHALDISTAVTERPDEDRLMQNVVKKLSVGVEVPLVIDTTEPHVLEVALKTAPGRCLINSTHLEGGRAKAERVFQLAREFNAAVICLTIDEQGMARTRQRKLEIARRLYNMAVHEFGLPPHALLFDTLTFTLATGDAEYADSAVETLEGIRLIKQELPDVLCSLGVSNVSFGLAPHARPTLNSVFLYHAVRAGLDAAIVNPQHVIPYADIPAEARELAEDLLFNRRPDALQRYIAYFETVPSTATAGPSSVDPTSGMSAAERLHWRIVHRHREGIESDIDELVDLFSTLTQGEEPGMRAAPVGKPQAGTPEAERDVPAPEQPFPSLEGRMARGENPPPSGRHAAAIRILNEILLPAMKEVGDKFAAGELILPFVLQSAEVMKKAVAHLERYLEKQEGVSKGTVVLATVYGDVHDIGKNLVKTILANNGYTVIDLGKQVPAETIIAKAVEVNSTAIGLSALLVSTSRQMPLIVNELHRRGLRFPVLIGGAAINRRFGRRILFTEDGTPYEAGVFYCKDAFEGLAVMDSLTDPQSRPAILERIRREAEMELGRLPARTGSAPVLRSSVRPQPIPFPRQWGVRVVRQMPLELVLQHLSRNDLFRLSWGAKNAHGEEWERLRAEFEARLARLSQDALRNGWLKPQGIYGYWPCQSEGNDLILYDPATLQTPSPRELLRFTFPRQAEGDFLCLADYFASVDSGQMDVVALQIVTVGAEATARCEQLQASGEYSEMYFVHGLAVQTAEAAAEYLHRHIRRELGLAENQGKRYSWGYPAIPDLSDHRKVFDLLPAEKELGMSLTPAYQLVPEQSTAAIIVHHREARYFNIGESRAEQWLKEREN